MRVVIFWTMCHLSLVHEKKALLTFLQSQVSLLARASKVVQFLVFVELHEILVSMTKDP